MMLHSKVAPLTRQHQLKNSLIDAADGDGSGGGGSGFCTLQTFYRKRALDFTWPVCYARNHSVKSSRIKETLHLFTSLQAVSNSTLQPNLLQHQMSTTNFSLVMGTLFLLLLMPITTFAHVLPFTDKDREDLKVELSKYFNSLHSLNSCAKEALNASHNPKSTCRDSNQLMNWMEINKANGNDFSEKVQ